MNGLHAQEALQLLTAEGLVPTEDGFVHADLVAFAEERGWTTSTEPVARPTPTRRWRATAFGSEGDHLKRRTLIGGAVAYGVTEVDALTMVIASLVHRQQRAS